MSSQRNIDIIKVRKPARQSAASHKTSVAKDAPIQTLKKKPSMRKPSIARSQKVGWWSAQVFGWQSVLSSGIFQLSFVRNLFSIRVLFFTILPALVYQFKYWLVLKPDELLLSVQSSLSMENVGDLIAGGLVIIALVILSWLEDSLITPAMARMRFAFLDNRKLSTLKAVRESSAGIFHTAAQKLTRLGILITFLLGMMLVSYGGYVLGYGSINQQTVLGVVAGVLALTLVIFYFALKFYLQVISAVGGPEDHSRVGIALMQTFRFPLANFGYSLMWILGLILVVVLNIGIVWFCVWALDVTSIVSLHILTLAGAGTLICVLWTVWSAWQNGYWTHIVHARSRNLHLVLSTSDQEKYWYFLIVVGIALCIIVSYIVLCAVFSDQIAAFLASLKVALPESFRLNLPKPQ